MLRKRKIDLLLKRSPSPILDIGSGIAPMAPSGTRVLLGDCSLTAMSVMRREGYLSAVLDIRNLGIKTGAVATVVCSEVLEHIDDDHRAITEIHRVLHPDGRLILTVPLHRHYWGRDDEIAGHHRRYVPGTLTGVLRSYGFEVLRADKVGSLFERLLTLTITVAFVKSDKSIPSFGSPFMSFFILFNRLVAAFLDLAALVSPQRLNSIALLYCRKN